MPAAVGGGGDEGVGAVLLPLERHAGLLLVVGARGFRDLPERLLDDDALLERHATADRELALAIHPRHPQEATLVQLLIIEHLRRRERARDERDLLGCLPDRLACELG